MSANDYYSSFYYPTGVTPLPDYLLSVTFENGEVKIFDVKPYLKYEFWSALKDQTLFNTVYIDGSVCWSNDLDIAPEEVWHNSKRL